MIIVIIVIVLIVIVTIVIVVIIMVIVVIVIVTAGLSAQQGELLRPRSLRSSCKPLCWSPEWSQLPHHGPRRRVLGFRA